MYLRLDYIYNKHHYPLFNINVNFCEFLLQRTKYGHVLDDLFVQLENYLTIPSFHACPYIGRFYIKDYPIQSRFASQKTMNTINYALSIRLFDNYNRTIFFPIINGYVLFKIYYLCVFLRKYFFKKTYLFHIEPFYRHTFFLT